MSATRAGAFIGPGFEVPRDEFVGPSALLALAVHAALAVALVVGVHWQSRAPAVVTVELWQAPPAPVVQPEPVRAKPAPPPPPPPKPEPRIEKPDIAVKAPVKPKPKPEVKPAPKPAAKPVPDERPAQQLLADALRREQQALAADRESRAIREQLAREAQAAHDRGMQTWVDKIRAKIRGNIVLPPDLQGNPEAMVLVTQLPTGEVLQAKLVISSGHAGYDDAIMRAILKSSPLPKPDSAGLFARELKLTFHPKD
ncbi:MAG: TonB C-terminal domain-containing protein [Betaproteobacteria bacterium]|nr:TonB C-terminal domain-containing protein [Betaproteobacteria bacterium]MDH5220871.1 TonB C-terminal domain-containing protein [Betaproteobacteria bacterium]MDH5349249.1 TonB C-terminal domain-containing protein [Betaproteobacteria bacterium]